MIKRSVLLLAVLLAAASTLVAEPGSQQGPAPAVAPAAVPAAAAAAAETASVHSSAAAAPSADHGSGQSGEAGHARHRAHHHGGHHHHHHHAHSKQDATAHTGEPHTQVDPESYCLANLVHAAVTGFDTQTVHSRAHAANSSRSTPHTTCNAVTVCHTAMTRRVAAVQALLDSVSTVSTAHT